MHEPSPWVSILLRPASWCFEAIVQVRRRRFDSGRGSVRLGMPVISVGNLTAGGTGKTPMCRWIVEQVQDAGRRPAIALRGYRAAADRRQRLCEHHEAGLVGIELRLGGVHLGSYLGRSALPKCHFETLNVTSAFSLRAARRGTHDLFFVLVVRLPAPDRMHGRGFPLHG